MTDIIYKICSKDAWDAAIDAGVFTGAPVDLADGYIHFSSATQVAETAAKHFKGQDNLVLVALDASQMGSDLKWEPSRGGELFPHLYGPLLVEHTDWVTPLPVGADGHHVFPDGVLP